MTRSRRSALCRDFEQQPVETVRLGRRMLVELETLVLELEIRRTAPAACIDAVFRARCGRNRIMPRPWCQVGM